MKISICIPTYNRPEFLIEAINSCLFQETLPYEILIGDDSNNDESEILIKKLNSNLPVKINYFHNKPSLKQASNVNALFDNASGDYILLLHDDDLLLPNALSSLSNCFKEDPSIDVSFGKQYLISEEGIIDKEGSEYLNKYYYRTSLYEGKVLTPLESGLVQQFPNNAYLIKSRIAKKIRYSLEVGDACDFDFGLRVGLNGYSVFFLNEYTAKYRLSKESVSKSKNNNGALFTFLIVEKLSVPVESEKYRSECLRKNAPIALVQSINLKNKKKAIKIYFSTWHRSKIFSLGGLKRLLLIFWG